MLDIQDTQQLELVPGNSQGSPTTRRLAEMQAKLDELQQNYTRTLDLLAVQQDHVETYQIAAENLFERLSHLQQHPCDWKDALLWLSMSYTFDLRRVLDLPEMVGKEHFLD